MECFVSSGFLSN